MQDMQVSFTRALQKTICDKLAMCSQDLDIELRAATITCSGSNSGTFSAIVEASNEAKIVESTQKFGEFTVILDNGISLSVAACSDAMCTATALPGVGNDPNSGLVVGVVISVLFLVAMVIAAAILVTIIIFKYR